MDVYNWFSWFHPPHIVYSICFFILPGYIRQIRNFILRYNSLLIWPERGILKWTRVFGADLQVRENRSTSVLILIKSFINKSELCRGKRTLMKIYSLGIELLSSPLRSECIHFYGFDQRGFLSCTGRYFRTKGWCTLLPFLIDVK